MAKYPKCRLEKQTVLSPGCCPHGRWPEFERNIDPASDMDPHGWYRHDRQVLAARSSKLSPPKVSISINEQTRPLVPSYTISPTLAKHTSLKGKARTIDSFDKVSQWLRRQDACTL